MKLNQTTNWTAGGVREREKIVSSEYTWSVARDLERSIGYFILLPVLSSANSLAIWDVLPRNYPTSLVFLVVKFGLNHFWGKVHLRKLRCSSISYLWSTFGGARWPYKSLIDQLLSPKIPQKYPRAVGASKPFNKIYTSYFKVVRTTYLLVYTSIRNSTSH